MEISHRTATCAARHIVAAHESACTEKPVDWGAVCAGCNEYESCRTEFGWFGWLDVMGPIFDEAGTCPQICRDDHSAIRRNLAVNRPQLRSIGFERDGVYYHVTFRWSFFRGITGGEVWAARGEPHHRALRYVGPIQYGTENLWERVKFWVMWAGAQIKRRPKGEDDHAEAKRN